jgi:hypothetical protein
MDQPTAAPAPGASVAPAPGIPTAPDTEPTQTPILNMGTVAPTIAPTINGTDPDATRRRIQKYFIAYNSPNASEPTQAQYDGVFNATNVYYNEYFREFWTPNSAIEFVSVTTRFGRTAFNQSGLSNIFPQGDNFNIYMEYNFTEFIFTPTSVVPSTTDIFAVMTEAIEKGPYIVDWVRPVGGPFATVNAAFIKALEAAAPSASP